MYGRFGRTLSRHFTHALGCSGAWALRGRRAASLCGSWSSRSRSRCLLASALALGCAARGGSMQTVLSSHRREAFDVSAPRVPSLGCPWQPVSPSTVFVSADAWIGFAPASALSFRFGVEGERAPCRDTLRLLLRRLADVGAAPRRLRGSPAFGRVVLGATHRSTDVDAPASVRTTRPLRARRCPWLRFTRASAQLEHTLEATTHPSLPSIAPGRAKGEGREVLEHDVRTADDLARSPSGKQAHENTRIARSLR